MPTRIWTGDIQSPPPIRDVHGESLAGVKRRPSWPNGFPRSLHILLFLRPQVKYPLYRVFKMPPLANEP